MNQPTESPSPSPARKSLEELAREVNQSIPGYAATDFRYEIILDALRLAVAQQQEDTRMLNWLDKHAAERCVGLTSIPKQGLMDGDRWSIHFMGIGFVGHSEATPANIRAAIASAMSKEKI